MAEEVVAAETAVEAAAVSPPVNTDHKRKLEDLEPQEEEAPMEQPVQVSSPKPIDPESQLKPNDDAENSLPDAKRPRLEDEEEEGSDGSALENGHEVQKSDETATENALNTIVENAEPEKAHRVVGDLQTENVKDQPAENPQIVEEHTVSAETPQASDVQPSSERNLVHPTAAIPQQVDDSSSEQQPIAGNAEQGDLTQPQSESESQTMSRKMEVPNNKVGVLIGKAGDTIRFLQYNSGAKIQITRDSEADRHSSTRPVELIGSLDNINKAEKLIKDVIAEADAGGSPSLVARGFGTVQTSGATEQIQIQVPNEKVGLIIGKGGETIKNLQTKSCARIQLIPQHLPEGDQSKERTVRVTGDKKQIEVAREMIKEVMNQPVRSSSHSGSYNQHTYRPRGPSGPPQWGSRGPAPNSHDYQQRGMYPSQNPQYMSQNYGGYPPQQPTPRSNNFNPGWEQRPSGPVPTPPQGSGYDYYAQGSHGAEAHGAVPANALPGTGGGGAPTQMNNYYGQPQGQEYGQPTNYPHSAPTQQNYGHGYEDPKYANQVAAHPSYGGHGNAQTGAYQQQVNAQHGYVQQPYSKPPAYGMQSQGPSPQAYGPPRATQPGDVPYQNPTQSYGAAPSQQQYPYASTGSAQQTYPYGPNPVANDGYNQAPSHAGPTTAYSQQGGQSVAGYGQPAGPPGPGYAQGGQAGGYGPYPSSQQGYTEQSVPNTGGYYQGPADTSYGAAPASAYGAPPNAQANYVQPTANQPGYEQQVPHSGAYASVPGSAAVGYKNLSPQPVYGQYDANQMYGGHH